MPVSRMRMRPWLEKMIDSSSISGLCWVDKDKCMFAIPWKHAARHGWEVDKDANLFKKWAIHTGKYVEGQTTADPKTWKANFRCAMNSLPDIEEVKDRSINKGHQAMRVYRMLEAPTKLKDKRCKTNQTRRRRKSPNLTLSEEVDYSDGGSPTECHTPLHDNTASTQENTVDSTVHQELSYLSTPIVVPEWETSVDILLKRFEVSPEHSTDYGEADMITLCQQLELDKIDEQWFTSNSDSTGYLSNEACTDSSYSSPGSQWSDNSADEPDPYYTILEPTTTSNEFFKLSLQTNYCL